MNKPELQKLVSQQEQEIKAKDKQIETLSKLIEQFRENRDAMKNVIVKQALAIFK